LTFFISIKPNQTVEASRFCPASDSQSYLDVYANESHGHWSM